MTGKILVEIDGNLTEVTKQELFDLAKKGKIQPETPLVYIRPVL
jgi:hypothetical protein